MIRILITLSCVFYLVAIPSSGFGKTYHVYYLGGQSNMDGYGTVNELPSDLKNRQPDVPIYHGSTAPDGGPLEMIILAEDNFTLLAPRCRLLWCGLHL